MSRILGVVLIMTFGVITIAFNGYSQSAVEQEVIEEIEGAVTEIDVIGGLLVVEGLNTHWHTEEMRFKVPDGLKIVQGTEDVGLQDLNISDPVVVRYYRNSSGELVVVSITDGNLGNNQM